MLEDGGVRALPVLSLALSPWRGGEGPVGGRRGPPMLKGGRGAEKNGVTGAAGPSRLL